MGPALLVLPLLLPGVAIAATPTPSPAGTPPAAGATPATTPAAPSTPAGTAAPVQVKGVAAAPTFNTRSWVLADLDTGQILAMRDPDQERRPASVLKLLTALTVVPRLHPDQPYLARKSDEKAQGNRVVLHKGLTYTVRDLLHGALLPSGNDAATALARANGGVGATVEQMNAEAQRVGAAHTVAKNTSGLDASGQVTTARDMAMIGRAAFANDEVAGYLKLAKAQFPGEPGDSGKRFMYPIYNHNVSLTDGFRGSLGGKSGYTSKAGRTYVGAAERNGRRLLVSMMGIGPNAYKGSENLLNWAFAHVDQLQPVGQLPEPSAPAPTFKRTVTPVDEPTTDTKSDGSSRTSDDAPTSTEGASSWGIPGLPGMPTGMPSVLTLLTALMAFVVLLRARVYWVDHRSRSAWTDLDAWQRAQARSARRRAPRSYLAAATAQAPRGETSEEPREAELV